jgi:hypothetical protein
LPFFTPHKGVLWPTSTTEDFIQNGEWMDGWIDGWMIQILIHKSQGEPQGTQVIFLACLYWRFHRQWGVDGCMNKGG